MAALVTLSSLIGALAVVQPKARDEWQVVPNLWGMTIGGPGVKKSPALSEALKPLNRLQADEFELHQAACDAWELECKVSAMQDLEAGDAPVMAASQKRKMPGRWVRCVFAGEHPGHRPQAGNLAPVAGTVNLFGKNRS